MYLRKGDNIIVLAGKDKGKKGKIDRVLRDRDMVIVDGVNIKKRHEKASRGGENQKGRIVEVAAPIHASNVALLDPKSETPTRVGTKIDENGVKVRIARKSGEAV